MQTENSLAEAADQQSVYTPTAFSYYSQLVTTPDTTPPTAPANFTGTPGLHHGESLLEHLHRQHRSSRLQRVPLHAAGGRPTLHGRLARHHDSARLQ